MTLLFLPQLGTVGYTLTNSARVLTMGASIEVRRDYSPRDLQDLARRSKDANQSRWLLALAAVLDGQRRAAAAKICGMDRQTLRDWVHRFNTEGPEGPLDRKAPGQVPSLSPEQKARLAAVVEEDLPTGPQSDAGPIVEPEPPPAWLA